MNPKSMGGNFLRLAGAGAGFALLLFVSGLIARPDTSKEPTSYSKADVERAEEVRRVQIDRKNPPRLQIPVDYSQGESAPWYPKGESPILADLVKAGKLPPVAERVGPEPCVMKGVDGVGKYGGTWMRVASTSSDAGVVSSRLSYANLLRFSPQGYPLVPHLAKDFSVSPDNREFIITLRKGVKWSDGHPFTTDDILYWWEHECNDKAVMALPRGIMKVRDKYGRVEKMGPYRVKFVFPHPNGLFLARLATYSGREMCDRPAHYLRQYHPTVGDKALIEKRMNSRKLPSQAAVYRDVKDFFNPDFPHLWPWIYRTYKASPPQTFVRNPYYFVVDPQGNQLPYVDRLLFKVMSTNMIAITAANGDLTMQRRHIHYRDYELLMSRRRKYGYDVYHWYPGTRSAYLISPNMNLRIDPDKPASRFKHELLNDKCFRQALSLAINRRAIIDAEFNGQGEPAQAAPGPASYFYEPGLYKSFVKYNPKRANKLLDDIGLTGRDFEGYRTFKDGSHMVFFFNYCRWTGEGPGQFIVDDWAKVGVRVILRERSRSLYSTEMAALVHDFNVWESNGEYLPLIEPRIFIGRNYALGFSRWYTRGGLYGDPAANREHGCIEPPVGHPLRKSFELVQQAAAHSDPAKQKEVFSKVLRIAAENTWTINISTPPPTLVVVKDGFKNVPRTLVASWDFQTPGNAGIETFYFEKPEDSPGAISQISRSIVTATLPPDVPAAVEAEKSGSKLGAIIRYSFLAVGILLVVLVALKHPYVGRRLLIMIPTLLIISVIVFIVIQLPPGDYVTTWIMQLRESGDEVDLQQIEEIREMFRLEDPVTVRYGRWLGLVWFRTLRLKSSWPFLEGDEKEEGLLQGNMGRSMENLKPVNDIIGDRILLTFLISLGTILFTWAIAVPIGIYSAVKQYSVGDYVFTFVGFIGMCVPGFLLALLVMYASTEWFNIPVTGLFSSRYGAQPEWTWGKVADLLKHIWVPVVVLGVGGTAGMIRVMRGNLLDELKKPYVTTARAKGVRPTKLLLKYPVRLALNPFISGIGGIFPILVSGGAIVAMVLSLPTVGPLMLSALMDEDMYLAGSMLMVLSLLGVLGTLVSDLLLLWLDPRIRFKGGGR